MKPLTLSALLCAAMALARAASLPEAEAQDEAHRVAKRSISCPCDWTEVYNDCFLYVPKAMTWAEAQRNCETMNANLASAHSGEEYRLMQKVVFDATKGYGTTWMGGSDSQQEKFWFWIDGTTFKYTNWCRGQPDNSGGNQDCMVMNFSGDKCWDDQGCEARRPSVCVKRIVELIM